jgi:hypothetical protein
MRSTELDRVWKELMSLCAREKELLSARSHPKVLKLVSREIDRIATELGFDPAQIAKREFRAERDGRHIVRILKGES